MRRGDLSLKVLLVDNVAGLKATKDLHQSFTPDLHHKLSKNMFKNELLWNSA